MQQCKTERDKKLCQRMCIEAVDIELKRYQQFGEGIYSCQTKKKKMLLLTDPIAA